MARFCVKCGSGLDPDARFCEECGAPVRARTPAQTAQIAAGLPRPAAAAVPLDIDWRKAALWSAVGVALLVGVGGVAVFLALPPSTPSASDLGELLNADKTTVADATCLSNFAYGKNPVVVGGFDVQTQQWMQMLSGAGIYGPPQPVANTFFGGGQQYSHTALGEKKIHGGKLCFADGMTVMAVQFAKPLKTNGLWHTQGTYSYTYRNADAWTQAPEAQRLEPEHFANLPKTASVSLVKGEHGWQLDNAMALNGNAELKNAIQGRTNSNVSASSGLLGKIVGAVSSLFGLKPTLIGTWRSDDTGETIEFTRDGAITNGHSQPITFEADQQDNERIYLVNAGVRLGTVEFIDHDHLTISYGLGNARFHRVG
jgi:hypothetical protein